MPSSKVSKARISACTCTLPLIHSRYPSAYSKDTRVYNPARRASFPWSGISPCDAVYRGFRAAIDAFSRDFPFAAVV